MKLREARASRLLTIQELAELAGVSFGTIRAIESGKSIPQLSTARKIATALAMEPGQIEEFQKAIESRGQLRS